jgi:hypothetical protein
MRVGILSLASMLCFRLTARTLMSLQKKQRLISTVIVGSYSYYHTSSRGCYAFPQMLSIVAHDMSPSLQPATKAPGTGRIAGSAGWHNLESSAAPPAAKHSPTRLTSTHSVQAPPSPFHLVGCRRPLRACSQVPPIWHPLSPAPKPPAAQHSWPFRAALLREGRDTANLLSGENSSTTRGQDSAIAFTVAGLETSRA